MLPPTLLCRSPQSQSATGGCPQQDHALSDGSAHRERFLDILGIDPDDEFVVGLVWYGYPKITPEQKRKNLDDVLTELP